MKKLITLILVLLICLTGCGRVSENTLNDVLEKDPSFKRILEAKKRIKTKILSTKNDFNEEKDITIEKVRALNEGLRDKKNNLRTQIASLKQELEPKILALRAKLVEKYSEYKSRAKDLNDSLSKLKNIGKLLEKKSELSLSGDEVSIWNKRVGNLEKKINFLRGELDKLRSQTRLLKTEIKILKE